MITDVFYEDIFPANFFDVVTAFQAFEHLADPAGDLERLYRCLKPGGIILIEVRNIATWSAISCVSTTDTLPDRLTFFSPDNLSALLKKDGSA